MSDKRFNRYRNIHSDQQIIKSWENNVSPWISAIRNKEIESRLLVTNKAIINAVTKSGVKSVLDAGCGEGWLVRELEKSGISSLGIDAVPKFIDSARKEGSGRFKVISYENLSYKALKEKFDSVVCNFSLLGNKSVIQLFENTPFLLNKGGSFIIQTIHPVAGCGNRNYKDGWRDGSWAGFSDKFKNPAPWYFRTLETWKQLYTDNGFNILEILEPFYPQTQIPASIIFIGVKSSLHP